MRACVRPTSRSDGDSTTSLLLSAHRTVRRAQFASALLVLALLGVSCTPGARSEPGSVALVPGAIANVTSDFRMSVDATSRAVTAGKDAHAEFTLTLSPLGGGGGEAALTVTSQPAFPRGVAATFEPASVRLSPGGATSTLRVRVPADAPSGRYELTITAAAAGDIRHATSALLSVSAVDNPIVVENRREGTVAWRLPRRGLLVADDVVQQVKGFASATSVAAGESLTLFVTVNGAPAFDVDVYRIGWYGGAGARLMSHVGSVPGVSQPPCPIIESNGLIACSWAPSLNIDVPATWTSGTYLALLTSSSGYQSYVPFVVRDDRPAAFRFQASVNTYQAYNDFPRGAGGRSLYTTPPAVRVSFDRPYAGRGDGQFLTFDLPLVQWLEQSGYDVTYGTDLDTHATHAEAGALRSHAGLVTGGHNEYWTKEMYDAVEQARDAGVHLMFPGANAVYWQVRLEPSVGGVPNRIMVCYKSATADPEKGPLSTTLWRDPVVGRPEQQLMGVQYTSQEEFDKPRLPYVVRAASSWVFNGTNLNDGDSVPDMIGYEVDRFFPEYPAPPGEQTLLSVSPFTGTTGAPDVANSSIYRAPSGAWVFAVGTTEWTRMLDPAKGNAQVKRITANVLDRFLTDATPRTR